jgi:hypothetical protein
MMMTKTANPRALPKSTRPVAALHQGGSAGQGDRRSSFLGHPTQSFLSARDPEIETAYGSCRSRGRQERAHRSLENRTERGFPQLPQAPSSPTKCHPCSRFTLLPIFPVAQSRPSLSEPRQMPDAFVHTRLNARRLIENSRFRPELPCPSTVTLVFLQQRCWAESVRKI